MLAKPGSAAAAPRSRRPPLCAPSQAAVESPVAVTRAAADRTTNMLRKRSDDCAARVSSDLQPSEEAGVETRLFSLQKRASAGQHNGAADVTSGQQSPRDEDDFLRSVSSDHVLRRWRHEPPRLGRSNSDGNPPKLCTRKVLAGHRPKIPNTNSAGTNETSASRRDRILDIKGIALSAPPKIRSKLEAYQAKPWKPEGTCGAS